jgi:hypothetical protein
MTQSDRSDSTANDRDPPLKEGPYTTDGGNSDASGAAAGSTGAFAPSSPPEAQRASASIPGDRLYPIHLPKPTHWPFVMALSTCFALWGVLTSIWVVAVGLGGVVLAAAGWVGDLRHEPFE